MSEFREDHDQEVRPETLRNVTVGLISAMVSANTVATSQEALRVTRRVVGRYGKIELSDETIQEITLQAIDEARAEVTPADLMTQVGSKSFV